MKVTWQTTEGRVLHVAENWNSHASKPGEFYRQVKNGEEVDWVVEAVHTSYDSITGVMSSVVVVAPPPPPPTIWDRILAWS